jgi:hypothetical protein
VRNNYRRNRMTESSGWRRKIPGMIALVSSGETLDTSSAERGYIRQPDSGATVTGMPRQVAGGRQRVRGDTVFVWRRAPPDSESVGAENSIGALEPSWETPILEGGGVILRRALSGATSRVDSAARLTRWVARQIATDTGETASITAAGTLRAGSGSPDGKARLLATLARMSRIPARVVTGVAVTKGGNFGHAWVELWTGAWVAADPTYGQFPASVSLVRLTTGDRSNPMDLLPLTASARFLPVRRPQ